MFNDVEELLTEIEKFKNNIAGIDSIAEILKKVCLGHETQNKGMVELINEIGKTTEENKQLFSMLENIETNNRKQTSEIKGEITKVTEENKQLYDMLSNIKLENRKQTSELKKEIEKTTEEYKWLNNKLEEARSENKKTSRMLVILIAVIGFMILIGFFV